VRRQTLRLWLVGALVSALLGGSGALAEDGNPPTPASPDLVKQANAPISSILQVRLQDSYAPHFTGVSGQGNTFTIGLTMPLPEYRLLPFPQLSLLTIPAAITTPSGLTGFGDLRFVDIAVFNAGQRVLWGVGPTFVFPTANLRTTGQGKWQAGPAAAIAFAPERWLVGVLAQNPISFAGDPTRADVNALILQPFLTYQFDHGWFIRSQPQMIFDWKTGKQLLPIDLGVGRVFKLGGQNLSCFVEGFWNVSHDGPGPSYGVTFGVSLLYPGFWEQWNRIPAPESETSARERSANPS
jgi:hypothetical protein